ncbi:MAG: hypothetical protein N2322_02950 [Terrimicrobiaceae bacterium]|nr:hypothetical protein [Terrimicrobiaceae bacterium]
MMAPAHRIRGKPLVLVLLAAAITAAAGTCSRFASDNPVTREVSQVSSAKVKAVFSGPGASRLRPGLPAKLSLRGSPQIFEGEVETVKTVARGVSAEIRFPTSLPQSSQGWLLSVEIIPPEKP